MLKQPVRTSLSDFIKTTMGSQFVIPVYQRTYTWTPEKETARYLDDMEDLLSGKTTNHFLGIIIYMDARISAMFRQLQIVDGQQRMTTSFIFLLALKRAALEKNDRATSGMIEDYYLFNRHSEGDAQFRLKPTVSNDEVFEKLIYGQSADLTRKEMESSVYRNYDYIYKRILNMCRKHSCLEILDTLSRMDVLEFPLSDTDNAQQIFESINSTGAPLTSADLIRNYVLMNHTNEVQERYYRMYWKTLERLYPQSRQLEDFFRYYLAVKTYTLHGRKDIYENFKVFWNNSRESAESKLQDINRYCRWCHDLFDGSLYTEEAEAAMTDYRRMNARVTAPFLMDMMRLQVEEKITDHEFAEIIRLLDSYIIRRNICGMDNGNLGVYFPTLLKAVLNAFSRRKNKNILSIIQTGLVEYNKGKTLAMPRDEDVRTRLKEVNAYNLSCIRAVLERLEHDGATAKVDLSALNIEHIMPQHPNRWWKSNSQTYDADDYTFCANLIGNLTLCAVYDNTRMGNEDFAFKKEVLSRTLHIRMNTEILGCDLWNRDVIVLRTTEMADRIVELYPYAIAKAAIEHNEEKPQKEEQQRKEEPVKTEQQKTETVNSDAQVVVIHTPTVDARILYHSTNKSEILAGTVMKPYFRKEMKSYRNMYYTMKNDGVIVQEETNRVKFARNAEFGSLNDAAGFLLHRGGDNSAVLMKEDGTPLFEKKVQEEAKTEPVQTEVKEENIPEGRIIVLNTSIAKAKAVFTDPSHVTVLEGSTLRSYNGKDMRRYRSLFLELRARNELVHVDSNTVVLKKKRTFTSLSEAAGFLMHRGGDCSMFWTNENGTPITGKPAVYLQKKSSETVQKKDIKGIELTLKSEKAEAHAVFCSPSEVVVREGSYTALYNKEENLQNTAEKLISEGVLAVEENKLIFAADYGFASLADASCFLLHSDTDRSSEFRHSDGRAITGKAPVFIRKNSEKKENKKKVTVRYFSKKDKEQAVFHFAGTPFMKEE